MSSVRNFGVVVRGAIFVSLVGLSILVTSCNIHTIHRGSQSGGTAAATAGSGAEIGLLSDGCSGGRTNHGGRCTCDAPNHEIAGGACVGPDAPRPGAPNGGCASNTFDFLGHCVSVSCQAGYHWDQNTNGGSCVSDVRSGPSGKSFDMCAEYGQSTAPTVCGFNGIPASSYISLYYDPNNPDNTAITTATLQRTNDLTHFPAGTPSTTTGSFSTAYMPDDCKNRGGNYCQVLIVSYGNVNIVFHPFSLYNNPSGVTWSPAGIETYTPGQQQGTVCQIDSDVYGNYTYKDPDCASGGGSAGTPPAASATLNGFFDGLDVDSAGGKAWINGWTCQQGGGSAIYYTVVNAMGTVLFSDLTDTPRGDVNAARDASGPFCTADTRVNLGFHKLLNSFVQGLGGQAVTIYGSAAKGGRDKLLAQIVLPAILNTAAAPPAVSAAPIVGFVDSVTGDNAGHLIVNGWTCQSNNPDSIYVTLLASGGRTLAAGVLANVGRGDVRDARICGTGSASYGYSIDVGAEPVPQIRASRTSPRPTLASTPAARVLPPDASSVT